MSIPAHFLHVYDKPKLGTSSQGRKQAYNYRHQISANGWFDTASCDLSMSPIESELAAENWVGNPVKVFVDNPSEPVWEGIITTVSYDAGGALVRRSIDTMMNRAEVVMQYTRQVGDETNVTVAANLIPSQDVYGVKEGSINAGVVENTTAVSGYATSLRDTLVEINGWPQSSITQGKSVNVRVEMKGYYHTLEWEMHWSTKNGNQNASVLITRLLAGVTNTTLWFDNADVSGVEANAGFQMNEEIRIGMTKWQGFLRVAEGGNATGAYFIVGIEPTNATTGTRRMYYRQANSDVEYTARAKDGLRPRNVSGGLIRPWAMKPDRVLRITDVMVGWAGQGDDPRDVYLRSISYDAERQSIRWQGSDNTTGEGVFQVNDYHMRRDNRWSKTKWLTTYV